VSGRSAVYDSARQGVRTAIARRVAARSRAKRHRLFHELTGAAAGMRVLDVGCGSAGLAAMAPELDVTGIDVLPQAYPGRFLVADPADGLPFEDGEFDIAYASSVIEHVAPDRRPAFAREVQRVARGWFVQTPAYSFPIEPHALLPFAHWLPVGLRRPYWRLGVAGSWEDIQLLRRAEMADLFGPPRAERFGPFVKSWISVR
jgi:SAM-dependent methyltransferase